MLQDDTALMPARVQLGRDGRSQLFDGAAEQVEVCCTYEIAVPCRGSVERAVAQPGEAAVDVRLVPEARQQVAKAFTCGGR